MTDDRALLMAVPLRHLESAATTAAATVVLPAGGVGDLDAAPADLTVVVMATDAGEREVPAATWRARFVGRVAHEAGAPWPAGIPATWADEHPAPEPVPDGPDVASRDARDGGDDDFDDDFDDDDFDDDEDEHLVQAFVEVSGLEALPRDEWLFANELVGKQARRGRSYRPRVPTIVTLPA